MPRGYSPIPRAPSLAAVSIFIVLCVLPPALMFLGAFFPESDFTLEKYRLAILNSRQLVLLGNSLAVAGGAALLSACLGVTSAFIIARSKARWIKYYKVAALVPLFIPPYLHALAWVHLFGSKGPVNQALAPLFGGPVFSNTGIGLAAWILAMAYHPFVTVSTYAGLRSITPSLEDAALLAMSPARAAYKVIIPMAAPYALAGVFFTLVLSLTNYAVPDLCLVRTYPVEIFINFSSHYDEAAAAALALPLMAISLALAYVIYRALRGRPFWVFSASGGTGLEIGPSRAAVLFALVSVLLASIVPAADLIAQAGDPANYVKTFKAAGQEFLHSAWLAVTTGALATIPAFFIAYYVARAGGKASRAAAALIYLPFAIPATIVGIGMIHLWNRPGTYFIYGGVLIVVMAHLARVLPFVTVVAMAAVGGVNPALEEAYSILRGGNLGRMARIVLPLCAPGLAAAFVVGAALSLGEVGATLMVMPPGMETLPVRIYSLLHYGASDTVSALGLGLIALSVSSAALAGAIVYAHAKLSGHKGLDP